MKRLTDDGVQAWLSLLDGDYEVWAPVRLRDGSRSLQPLSTAPLALAGGPLPQKPTAAFFPQMEVVLSLRDQTPQAAPPAERPRLVVGFTAEDLDCLAFIDRFYGETYRDTAYFAKRDGAVVIGVTGRCGRDGALLRPSEGNCDLELIHDGTGYLLLAHSAQGRGLADRAEATDEAPDTSLDPLRTEARDQNRADRELLEQASALLQADQVPDTFWDDIALRCIACTTCNLVCPTCTCFDVFDRRQEATDDRWRLWDSCQLDGFMREASGHNPMGRESMRTRRRIHHKLSADPARWGQITCLLCGRCDEACPTGIGIKAVCREMVDRFGT